MAPPHNAGKRKKREDSVLASLKETQDDGPGTPQAGRGIRLRLCILVLRGAGPPRGEHAGTSDLAVEIVGDVAQFQLIQANPHAGTEVESVLIFFALAVVNCVSLRGISFGSSRRT